MVQLATSADNNVIVDEVNLKFSTQGDVPSSSFVDRLEAKPLKKIQTFLEYLSQLIDCG